MMVVELLRQVVKHLAIRRMDGGSLSDEQIEKVGPALWRLEEKMAEILEVFGLAPEDLNIDLRSLGTLL